MGNGRQVGGASESEDYEGEIDQYGDAANDPLMEDIGGGDMLEDDDAIDEGTEHDDGNLAAPKLRVGVDKLTANRGRRRGR